MGERIGRIGRIDTDFFCHSAGIFCYIGVSYGIALPVLPSYLQITQRKASIASRPKQLGK
jgi:hypothetical protein